MIAFNGEILNRKDFTISAGNRAFRYGDGVFETIRVSQGCVLWADMHFERLSNAIRILQLLPDLQWSQHHFEKDIIRLCDANGLSNARIRLSLFRNEGGYYTPLTNRASVLMESEALDHSLFTMNSKGLSVDLFPDIHKSFSVLSALKSINAQIYVLAGIYKRNKGLGDILLLNNAERIAEAGASNIFAVQKNKLITPPLSEACVDGIMRKVMIRVAEKQGITVIEAPLTIDSLLNADELLLTNSIQGVRWVRSFREKHFGNQLGTQLISHLNDFVEEYCRKKMSK